MRVKIKERRLNAMYKFSRDCNSTQKKALLEFLLATISDKHIKDLCENFNLDV